METNEDAEKIKGALSIPEAAGGCAENADAITDAVRKEREWLNENDAVSAVSGGPVEDLEGVPLPADTFQEEPKIPELKPRAG